MVRKLIHSSSNNSSNRSDTSKAKTLSPTFNHNTERSEQLIEAVTFLHGVLNIHFANMKLLEKLKTQLQFIFKVFSFQFISPHLLQFTILSFHSFLCFIKIFCINIKQNIIITTLACTVKNRWYEYLKYEYDKWRKM